MTKCTYFSLTINLVLSLRKSELNFSGAARGRKERTALVASSISRLEGAANCGPHRAPI